MFNVIPVKTGTQIPPNHKPTPEMPNWGFLPRIGVRGDVLSLD